MKEQDILELVRHNERLYIERKRGQMRGITHPRNPYMVYYPIGAIQGKCEDGKWRPMVLYVSKSQERYLRRADNFEKFEVVDGQ